MSVGKEIAAECTHREEDCTCLLGRKPKEMLTRWVALIRSRNCACLIRRGGLLPLMHKTATRELSPNQEGACKEWKIHM
jgi:hypothetical protein